MYTASRYECPFTGIMVTEFFRDGHYIGHRDEGQPIVLEPHFNDNIELTRAQGFKYWKRHFSNRSCYTIPEALAQAIERTPKSFGYYFNKYGKLCGYEG